MDTEQKHTLKRRLAWISAALCLAIAWAASTIGAAWTIAEVRAHGAEHAYVKQLMAKDAQHEQEHQLLRQIVQMINQQAAQRQPAPIPAK